ncbi:MAG: orotate phosphoribosyltransferase [Butyrivibrio sp.]|uniref:phosphoribosyltransferase family protein n=1 Tax=Butyrivibrio sp. NC2002 TaxID=1410610 RepID=UPI000569A6CB|nr:phosphoribosyltransferase family protein [Butyrivibrio sp. NC2002]MBE5859097.1 orotate phosphoribosyltransferase [Butyrivibrio sp.]
MQGYKKLEYSRNTDVILRYTKGHFITPHSHVNYYLDMCDTKARMKEARAAGESLAELYLATDVIDTILCLDGMEVVGSYLANKLTESGVISMNSHKTMYITGPEVNVSGQMMFRENTQHMVSGKKVLILTDSVTTGGALKTALESIRFYKGEPVGVAAVFSIATQIENVPIRSLFSSRDLSDYASYSHDSCPLCRDGVAVDAICNGFGISTM